MEQEILTAHDDHEKFQNDTEIVRAEDENALIEREGIFPSGILWRFDTFPLLHW